MIAHIVFFKLSDPSPANVTAAREKLLSLEGRLPMLRHLEVGADLIHSPRSCDVALYTHFESLEDLQAYQVHPYHADDVAAYMKSVCSAIHAVDYEIER